MKKFLVICLLFFFISPGVFAGGLGIKGGINFASISNLEEDLPEWNIGRKTGFIAGVFLRLDLGDSFSVQPEAFYSQKGVKVTANIGGTDVVGKEILDYIEFPVLLKFRIPNGKITPCFFAGPYIAILLSAKEKYQGNGMSGEMDVKEDLETLDYGITFGAGLDYDIGHSSIVLEVRFSLGLMKISIYEEDPEYKNSVLSIMLGYAF